MLKHKRGPTGPRFLFATAASVPGLPELIVHDPMQAAIHSRRRVTAMGS